MGHLVSGQRVRCIKGARYTNGPHEGREYILARVSPTGRTVWLGGDDRPWNAQRFEPVGKPTPSADPYGTVKSLSVDKADIYRALTGYVAHAVGIADVKVVRVVAEESTIKLVLERVAAE